MRYSIAVSSGAGSRHVVELGSSVQSTVARNLPNDVFSESASKNSEEYLEMLRERRRSRAQLTKAYTLAEKFDSDNQIEIEITDTAPKSSTSPVGRKHTTTTQMSRSMPEFSVDELSEEEEEEDDVISKLVGRTALLTTPSRSGRKVSLQEELCGRAPQTMRSMRTSVAGDIVRSADSSPLNKDPISPSNPYRGLPNIPGLIIPDKWKEGFADSQLDGDGSLSPSSESESEFESRIELSLEPTEDRQLPNSALLGYELAKKNKTISNSESDKDESDADNGLIKPNRIKRRKSSSERRRSQPELDLCAGEDSDEEEFLITTAYKQQSVAISISSKPHKDEIEKHKAEVETQKDEAEKLINTHKDDVGTHGDKDTAGEAENTTDTSEEAVAETPQDGIENPKDEILIEDVEMLSSSQIDIDLVDYDEADNVMVPCRHDDATYRYDDATYDDQEDGTPDSSSWVSPETDTINITPVETPVPVASSTPEKAVKQEVVHVGKDGKIQKKESSVFKYMDSITRPSKEDTEEKLKSQIRGMQEEIAKSDLIIAELSITIEDLRDYNTKLENDIQIREDDPNINVLREPLIDFEQSDEWLNLEIEVARLQKEVTDRDTVIRTQKDALDKTLSKGSCASPRQISLAGAVKQALDVNVSEMARLYNETLRLCRSISTEPGTDNLMNEADREFYERKLDELDRKHYELIEELGFRHTEEMQTMRSDYEVLLELAVKEKEDEMRNTIIENGELEDLAEQVETLSGELQKKEKEISIQRCSISYLEEELQQINKRQSMAPVAPPQIIIEDPEGRQQCDYCEEKDRRLQGMEDKMSKIEDHGGGSDLPELRRQNDILLQQTTELEERLKVLMEEQEGAQIKEEGEEERAMRQRIEHLVMEKEEATGLAKADIKNFYNSLYERFSSIDKTFHDLRNCKSGVKNDLHRLRCEMEQFSVDVVNVLNNFQTLPQQQPIHTSESCLSVALQTDTSTDNTSSVNNGHASATHHVNRGEIEGKYVKEIFELKVKLKELEAKVSHLNKKAKAAKNVPRTEYIVEGPNKEEKLMEILHEKEEELRQARRLHGQNLATMRRRHDKVVGGLQANVDRLEMSVHQFIPRESDSKKRSRSLVLPQPPGHNQNENYIIMQQAFTRVNPRDVKALLRYR